MSQQQLLESCSTGCLAGARNTCPAVQVRGLCCMQVDILCTHPMFGPDSGKGSWAGLKFMFEKVRVGGGERRQRRAEQFLQARQPGIRSWQP